MITPILRTAGARRYLGRLRRRLSARRFVLVYHRVAEPAHDPWNLAVSPARFDEQLQVLRTHGPVMPVRRMLRELDAGTLPRRAAAVTFDDGYADTLHDARPLLARHDAPASVYLCPALLDGRSSFWWDSLARIVFEPRTLPPLLETRLGDRPFAWAAATRPAPVARERSQVALARQTAPPDEARQALYLALTERLRPLPFEQQRQALSALSAWADLPESDDPRQRPLDWAEAARLAEDGLVEIGAHTLTHVSLPACGADRKRSEIAGAKEACEQIAGRRVESFSYPFNDHDAEAAAAVREAGFTDAWTTSAASLRRTTDRFRLPRVPVRNWDGAELERRLATADFA